MTNFKPQCYYDTYFNAWGWHDNQGYFHKEDFSQWASRVFHQNANWILPAVTVLVGGALGFVMVKKHNNAVKVMNEYNEWANKQNAMIEMRNGARELVKDMVDYGYSNLLNDCSKCGGTDGSVGNLGVSEPTNLYVDDGMIRFIPNTSDEYVPEEEYTGNKL